MAGSTTWPRAVTRCMGRCGRGPGTARYRTRGLCRQCYVAACESKELWRYEKLDDDLTDDAYAALLANPRRYVRNYYGETHAIGFSDDKILAEAVRIFDAGAARWRGEEAYLADVHPDYEDVVWGVGETSVEPEPYESKVVEVPFMKGRGAELVGLVLQYAPALRALPEPVMLKQPPTWEIAWGDDPQLRLFSDRAGDVLIAQRRQHNELLLSFTPTAVWTCAVRHLKYAGAARAA